jgi:GntR family transcriptional regulator, transcriptional repressor for pyruvate dehydrogenase complex
LRLAMESFAAELAATNRSPEQLVEMEDALQQMERIVVKLSDGPDSEALSLELAKEDIHFHLAILNASGNGLLRQEVLRVHLLNKLVNVNLLKLNLGSEINDNKFVMDIERRKYVQSCHRKIYEAILSGESEAARLAMYQHLKEIIDRSMILVARRERNREGNAPLGADALGASV